MAHILHAGNEYAGGKSELIFKEMRRIKRQKDVFRLKICYRSTNGIDGECKQYVEMEQIEFNALKLKVI